MNRKTMTICAALCLLVVGAAAAQDLDEVLAGNYEARGGLDTIKGTDSAVLKGTMSMGGGQMEAPFTITWKRPNMIRMEFVIQGQTGVQAYDGETAWQHMAFMGKTDPEELAEEQSKELMEQSDIMDGPLIDSESKGHSLELIGKEEVEGSEAYKVKVTKSGGDVEYYYLDAEYLLTIKQTANRKMGESEVEVESTFGDFKEAGGLMFPHYMESKAVGAPGGQIMTIESIELGVEVDESQFAMPEVTPAADAGSEG